MKRFLMFTAIFLTVIGFGISYSFANNSAMEQMKDSVRNVVGGTENVVEDTAKDTSNAIKGGFNSLGDKTNSAVHGTTEAINNTAAFMTDNHNDGYNARRTAGDTDIAGMNRNVWMWLVIGAAAIAAIGFIWYYAMRKTDESTERR